MTYTAWVGDRMRTSSTTCRVEQTGARRRGGGRGERLHGLTLLVAEIGGHLHVDGDDQVAVRSLGLDALVPDAVARATLRPGLEPQLHRPSIQRRHLDRRAERGLGERDRHAHRQVVAVTAEDAVWRDPAFDDQVAGRTAVAAWPTAPLQADPLPVGDAGRDAHLNLARPTLDAGAPARRARLLDDHAGAVALAARRGEREEPLVLVDHASPPAQRADLRLRAGLGPAAVARGALRVARQVQRRGDAVRRVGEVERQVGRQVVAALRAGGGGRATATAA